MIAFIGMDIYLLALFLAPPVVSLVYATTEHLGWVDRWTGRQAALEGLNRLKSAAGHPKSWLYSDDDEDPQHFRALERRISKRTTVVAVSRVLLDGHKPTCITIGGDPIHIPNVPNNWNTSEKRGYLPSHSVMYLFGVTKRGGRGKAERVCSVADLEKWLDEEKRNRLHILGVLVIGVISMSLIVIRLSII